ncbi:leucine-rich repeat domain-containing protein [Alienimonas californiensis]|uniref:hypothetical protein n=1 Tax=Alienimonas californiensis TaxID=2527989 RepID=UPI00119E8CBE|nr:hypothetical protein [Alienimonas californiensis]
MRAVLFGLAGLVLIPLAGCDREEEPPAAPPPRAWVEQLDESSRGERTAIELSAEGLRPDHLSALGKGGEAVERITLVDVPQTADREAFDTAWRSVLPSLPNLRRVTFDGPVSADVFAEAGTPPLTHLNLPAAAMGSSGFRALLAGRPSLELLRLHAPGVRDEDLAGLADLPRLRFLHLIDAPLTDAAVPHLAAGPALESVYLDRSRLTWEGWEELHRLRPDLHLHADLTHPVGGH